MEKFIIRLISVLLLFIAVFTITLNCQKVYALSQSSNQTYEGIDVSDWQGYIDYAEVRESGIEVVYIKASQGSNIKDPYFDVNYENAKANGLKVGFYHFLTATNTEEAVQQANFFSSVISGKVPDCKLVMDFEVFDGLGNDQINEISKVFLETVKNNTQKDVAIYSDLYNAQNVFSRELANEYELWIAYYGNYEELNDITTNWDTWIGVQYSDRGRINGIDGNVDLDLYTQDILLDENSEVPRTESPNDSVNSETIVYRVKRGDTLWEISRMYGTTIQEIVNLNNIENPNLIYPGETIRIITNSNIHGSESRATGKIIYTVKRGDTLWSISRKYGVSIQRVVELNDIVNPSLIYPGERFRI